MEIVLKMVNIQAVLLVYLLCGVYCRRKNIITEPDQQKFIDFVLAVLMPCMVFNSFKNITLPLLKNAVMVLLVSLGICFLSYFAGKVLYRRYERDKRNVLRYATLVNNAGFAGLPLAQEQFGDEGTIYASIFLIPIRIFMWSAGITMLSEEKTDIRGVCARLLKNPCIIAVLLGILRGLLQIEFPVFAENALSRLAACVSPISMILIGAIIADVKLSGIFEGGVLFYVFIRLVALPLAALGLGRTMGLSDIASGTSMILTAMPAATTTALLSARYHSDVIFASRLVLVSTVLSLITAPVLMLLL